MIVLDSSVLIDYVRGKDAKLNALLPTVIGAVCEIVRAELLCGARSPNHRADLEALLTMFHQLPIPESLWDIVGDHLARFRVQGLTVPLSDVVIATLGIEHDLEVWSNDPHFAAMQKHLPRLKLYLPPP